MEPGLPQQASVDRNRPVLQELPTGGGGVWGAEPPRLMKKADLRVFSDPRKRFPLAPPRVTPNRPSLTLVRRASATKAPLSSFSTDMSSAPWSAGAAATGEIGQRSRGGDGAGGLTRESPSYCIRLRCEVRDCSAMVVAGSGRPGSRMDRTGEGSGSEKCRSVPITACHLAVQGGQGQARRDGREERVKLAPEHMPRSKRTCRAWWSWCLAVTMSTASRSSATAARSAAPRGSAR